MPLKIVINEENLLLNLSTLKNKVGERKICAVLRGNAYGHGLIRVALTISNQVDSIAVTSCSDGVKLRKYGVKLPIIVLLPTFDNTLAKEYDLQLKSEFYDSLILNADTYRGASLDVTTTCDELDDLRCGMCLYGYPKGFNPVMEVYSRVLAIKKLAPYQSLGSSKYLSGSRGDTIAMIVGGYADGFGRDFLGSHLLIRDKTYPIIGVSMDTTFLKVDDSVSVGDEVVICGSSKFASRYFDTLAEEIGTVPYELMTRFGQVIQYGKE